MSGSFVHGFLFAHEIPRKVISEKSRVDLPTLSRFFTESKNLRDEQLFAVLVAIGEVKAERKKKEPTRLHPSGS